MKLSHLLLLAGAVGLLIGGGTLFARGATDEAQTTYWPNGRLQSRIEYEGGKPHGQAERWYPDGKLQEKGRYEAGRMEGAWQYWLPDGSADPGRSASHAAGERR